MRLCLYLALPLVLVLCALQGFAGVVSPDGKSVVYRVPSYDDQADPVSEVFIAAADHSSKQSLTKVPGHLSQISWIGSDRFALGESKGMRYVLLTTKGERLPDVQLPAGARPVHQSLSPDGTKIAFEGRLERSGTLQYGLYVCDADTGDMKRLTEKLVRTTPAWSPDSRRVAIGIGGYQKDYPLVIFDVETGRADETGVKGVGVSWSPDGKSIACTTDVKQGGSWFDGMPRDGKLGVYDISTRKMKVIEGTEGAIRPAWSADGKLIAYWDWAGNRICVVGRDGQGLQRIHKVKDDHIESLSWVGGEAVYIQSGLGLVCAPYPAGEARVIAEWKQPEAPELQPSDFRIVETARVTVRYARFDEKYAEALGRILSEALLVFEELGFKMPEKVTLEAYIDPGQTSLWTDGESSVFLRLSSKEILAPSTRTGVFNIYGMCHELGHIAMYKSMSSLSGLPGGVAEGWAHYAGSVVVSEVADRLGEKIWPEYYDVGDFEGMGRLGRQAAMALGKTWDEVDETARAALVFYRLDVEYGRQKLAAAMVSALKTKPSGKDLMGLVVDHLREQTGRQNAAEWVPKSIVVSEVKWQVKERNPGEEFFADQKVEKDQSGVLLSYGDGTMDSKVSTAGAGYTVLFRAQEGSWQLDGIKLFGSRYGLDDPPDEDFHIYVCNGDFEVLHNIPLPYGKFEKGDERWYDLKFDPVDVPAMFYVCVDFQATATKGVYIGKDTVKQSHSYFALPYTFIKDAGDFDWMIRAHLRPKM